jgi:hypothetical protein
MPLRVSRRIPLALDGPARLARRPLARLVLRHALRVALAGDVERRAAIATLRAASLPPFPVPLLALLALLRRLVVGILGGRLVLVVDVPRVLRVRRVLALALGDRLPFRRGRIVGTAAARPLFLVEPLLVFRLSLARFLFSAHRFTFR